MTTTATITPPATATKLSTLISAEDHCKYLIMQAPTGNSGLINWGYNNDAHFLAAGDFIDVPGTRVDNILVSGDGSDQLIVSVR